MSRPAHLNLSLLGLILASCVALSAAATAAEPLNILFYGNSFTLGHGSDEAMAAGGVPGVVSALAAAAGHPAPRIENAAEPGQSLTWHLANNTSVIADPQDFAPPPDFQWDAVVLQGFSTRPTHIGDLPQFRADLLALVNVVRAHSASARPVLYQTWARGPGHDFYSGSNPPFPGGPAQMQQELRDGYELARQDVDAAFGAGAAAVAPVGSAWESTGWDDLHADDIYHANSRGTYLAALVIFGTIYREPTSGLPGVLGSIDEVEAAALQAYADGLIPDTCGFDGSDCNGNCIPDRREPDCNMNDVPDACEGPGADELASCLTGPCDADGCDSGWPSDCCLADADADGDADLRDVAIVQAVRRDAAPSASVLRAQAATISLTHKANH